MEVKKLLKESQSVLVPLAKVLRHMGMLAFSAEMESTLSKGGGDVTERLVLSSLGKLQASFPRGMFGRFYRIRWSL